METFISILVSTWKESLLGMLLKTQDKYLSVFIREKKTCTKGVKMYLRQEVAHIISELQRAVSKCYLRKVHHSFWGATNA